MKVSEINFNSKNIEKFWSYVNKGNEDECWEWFGKFTGNKIPIINMMCNKFSALRLAFFFTYKDIDEDLQAIRNCKNTKCCNPAHIKQPNIKIIKLKPGPVPKEKRKCLNCKTEYIKKGARGCCSFICSIKYTYDENIRKWKSGEIAGGNIWGVSAFVRTYLFNKYNNKCALCGWCEVNQFTGKIPLEVEHINGVWQDDTEENLTLICPNCHSLTPTFRSKNRGRGRYSVLKEMGKTPFGLGSGK